MSTLSYNIANSNGGANASIKRVGDTTERCNSNCSSLPSGSTLSGFDNSGTTKGVSYDYTLILTEGACTTASNFSVCCPATGGSISGSLTPTENTQQTYTISGIDGNYAESGGNNGWSIVGGASIVSSGSGTITLNVGTQTTTLCYNIVSCGESRSICVTIVPQTGACTLSVSSLSISC